MPWPARATIRQDANATGLTQRSAKVGALGGTGWHWVALGGTGGTGWYRESAAGQPPRERSAGPTSEGARCIYMKL